jgi:V8-like Glu-specific endopeptidase
MANASIVVGRKWVLLFLIAVIVAVGSVSPVAAAGRGYDEMPAQVMTKGLRAEQHLERQVLLSRRLSRELPSQASEKAVYVALSDDEAGAIDKGSRWESPLKIGAVKAMAPGIMVAGLSPDKQDLPGGFRHTATGFVWAAVVRAENAGAIRLHVQEMSLPQNAELYVYSRNGQAYGPYTGNGPNFSGEFWTTAIFGPEAILQLRFSGPASEADLSNVFFKVTDAGLITKGFAGSFSPDILEPAVEKAPWPCGNDSCIIDATCTNVAIANPAKLAMAKMEWVSGAFLYTCTGGLINDTNPTQSNFFLTANHCLSKNAQAQNVSFYWRYATSSCNGTCPVNGGWPYITTGSTVSSTNRRADYTLLRLNSNPPAGSVVLGWSSAPIANTNGAALYRISNPGFGPQVYSQHNVDTSAGTCQGWPRGQWIYSRDITGAIDGGSSGSPVMNASSQVVGQLSGTCGFAPSDVCLSGPGESNATVDGAFANFYPTIQPIINP